MEIDENITFIKIIHLISLYYNNIILKIAKSGNENLHKLHRNYFGLHVCYKILIEFNK